MGRRLSHPTVANVKILFHHEEFILFVLGGYCPDVYPTIRRCASWARALTSHADDDENDGDSHLFSGRGAASLAIRSALVLRFWFTCEFSAYVFLFFLSCSMTCHYALKNEVHLHCEL